jgi:hypothetical protein
MMGTFINATITVIGQSGMTANGSQLTHQAKAAGQISLDKAIFPAKIREPIAETQPVQPHQVNRAIEEGAAKTLALRPEPLGPGRLPGTREIKQKSPQTEPGSRRTNLLTVSIAKPRDASVARKMRALTNGTSKDERAVQFRVKSDRFEVGAAECTGVNRLIQQSGWSASRFRDLHGFALELNPERSLGCQSCYCSENLSDAHV